MTQVYNYYALPPAQTAFCQSAMRVSEEAMAMAPADLETFSQRNLAMIESVFEDFYRSYEQYLADAAAWDARYAPTNTFGAPVYGGTVAGADDRRARPRQVLRRRSINRPTVLPFKRADPTASANGGIVFVPGDGTANADAPGDASNDATNAAGIVFTPGTGSEPAVEPAAGADRHADGSAFAGRGRGAAIGRRSAC